MKIGDRVKIKPAGGMAEFYGKTGRVVSVEKYAREPAYYRVELDEPVTIGGVGLVHNDLWQANHLTRIR